MKRLSLLLIVLFSCFLVKASWGIKPTSVNREERNGNVEVSQALPGIDVLAETSTLKLTVQTIPDPPTIYSDSAITIIVKSNLSNTHFKWSRDDTTYIKSSIDSGTADGAEMVIIATLKNKTSKLQNTTFTITGQVSGPSGPAIAGVAAQSETKTVTAAVPPRAVLIGFEVVQVIQDWKNTIPLIERKTTFVRVHLESKDEAEMQKSRFKLIGKKDNIPLPWSPLSDENLLFTAPPESKKDSQIIEHRNVLDQSLLFQLQKSWTIGKIELTLEDADKKLVCREPVEVGGATNDCKVTVEFVPSKTIDIKLFPVQFTDILE
jgi:hypothetical protein